MRTLNLGIVAHVDAGKTSLTERLLYDAGVIRAMGSVDAGSTQTDSMALERRRGITIRSAVASFPLAGVTVNVIDTPGHPDFIAEVERALRVLDGAVLVVSAVEGVQAQTRVLIRTLRRLRVPTLVFVNKIDRAGAREHDLLSEIAGALEADVVAMSTVAAIGTPSAEAVARPAGDPAFAAAVVEVADDEKLLAAYVAGDPLPAGTLESALAARTAAAGVYPVFFGSAITGTGVDALTSALPRLLPAAAGDAGAPLSGTVFKVDRDAARGRIAYARLFSGTLRTRDRIDDGSGTPARVTAIDVVEGGTAVRRDVVAAGGIGKLHGLRQVRVGDAIGAAPPVRGERHLFAPPTGEAAVVADDPGRARDLFAALTELAEQDPLIGLRRSDDGLPVVSLYGEVQKEVIQATLADGYGVGATFRETTVVYTERLAGTGHAEQVVGVPPNPYVATLGFRVAPAAPGSGIELTVEAPVEQLPIYVYRTHEAFHAALRDTLRDAVRSGPHGWPLPDLSVTCVRSGFAAPVTGAGDYRKLAPLVLMAAVEMAGTVVCEPIQRFHLDGPARALGGTLGGLGRYDAVPDRHELRGERFTMEGTIPAVRVRELERALPGLTHGEGSLECVFDSYRPVRGEAPSRLPWRSVPFDRTEYALRTAHRLPTA